MNQKKNPKMYNTKIVVLLHDFINFVQQNPEFLDTFTNIIENLSEHTFNNLVIRKRDVYKISILEDEEILTIEFNSINEVIFTFTVDAECHVDEKQDFKRIVNNYFVDLFVSTNDQIRRALNIEARFDRLLDDVLDQNKKVIDAIYDPEVVDEYQTISFNGVDYILSKDMFIPVNKYFGIYIIDVEPLKVRIFGDEYFRVFFEDTEEKNVYLTYLTELQDYLDKYSNNPITLTEYKKSAKSINFYCSIPQRERLVFKSEFNEDIYLSVVPYNNHMFTNEFEVLAKGINDEILEPFENSPIYSYVYAEIIQHLIDKYDLKNENFFKEKRERNNIIESN